MKKTKAKHKKKQVRDKKFSGKNKPDNKQSFIEKWGDYLWIVPIVVITYVLYFPAFSFDFINWDTDRYVIDNPYITELTWENVKYYFTNFYFLMYLPITLLTYAVDYHIASLDPSMFHITNVIFHLFNSAFVFLFIYKLLRVAGKDWKLTGAVIVSALFAIHPLHIESAVWVAERKDVVYTFFFFLSLIFYLNYFNKKNISNYLIAIAFFLFSLISKAQAMTLPIILVIVDYFLKRNLLSRKVIIEKIPFFILSVIFGIIAIMGTRSEGVSSNASYTIFEKIVYASYGFVTYIVKLIVPYKLSVIYPYPITDNHAIPLIYWLYLIPVALIAFSFFWFFNRKREISFGIAFFTGSIFVVLQIFAYHNFIMADRYSYVSSIGIFFILAWLVSLLIQNFSKLKNIIYALVVGYLLFLGIFSHFRLKDWKDSITVWEDVRSKYPEVLISYYNGANAKAEVADKFMATGKKNEALEMYNNSLADYDKAIEMKDDYIGALANRGITRAKIGIIDGALQDFNRVIEIDPEYNNVYSNRGNVKVMLGKQNEAILDYNKALEIKPNFTDALFNRGMAYSALKQYDKALADLSKVIQLNPKYQNAYPNRGMLHTRMKMYKEALADYNRALQFNPNNIDAIYNRGVTYIYMGDIKKGINDFNFVIRLNPNIALPYYQRADAYIRLDDKNNACNDYNKALKLGMQQAQTQIERYCK